MTDKGLRETLEQTLDALAEPGFPTDRAAYSPALRARYEARARDLRAAAFSAALKWLLGKLPGRRSLGGPQARDGKKSSGFRPDRRRQGRRDHSASPWISTASSGRRTAGPGSGP